MPELTPRQRLTERVASRFVAEGFNPKTSYPLAVLSVEAFYAQNEDSSHYALVCEEAIAIIIDVMPPFVTHMRAAFEAVASAMSQVTQAAQAVGPYADIAMRLKKAEETEPQPRFDSSGLPVNEAVSPLDPEVRNRQGEPCIEDGCGATAVAGSAFCVDCMPDATRHSAILQAVTDDLTRDAVIPPELLDTVESIEVIDITPREFHQAAARTLRGLGCTYNDLKAMYLRGEFETAQHRSAWFSFGGLLNMELLDRAIDRAPVVGLTDTGEEVRGPVSDG